MTARVAPFEKPSGFGREGFFASTGLQGANIGAKRCEHLGDEPVFLELHLSGEVAHGAESQAAS